MDLDESPADPPERKVVDEAIAELILQEARSGVEQQRQDLKTVRDRAVTVTTVATLVAGFLGKVAPSTQGPSWLFVCACASYLVVVVLSLVQLRPLITIFSNDPRVMLDDPYLEERDLVDVARNLARSMGDNWATNQAKITPLYRWFRISLILLGVETLLFLADLRF